jgi:hypothetical protein
VSVDNFVPWAWKGVLTHRMTSADSRVCRLIHRTQWISLGKTPVDGLRRKFSTGMGEFSTPSIHSLNGHQFS